MTREEQIDWLCRLRTDLNNGVIFTPWNKEFTEALDDVLEQEPTTKNDLGVDCIDRNSIKYYLGTGGYMYASKGEIDKLPSVTIKSDLGVDCVSRADVLQILLDYDYANENALVLKDIKALPSVIPQEPRKGYWVDCKCDKCGYVVQPWNTTNFCPNCGDMKEVENEKPIRD